jgi:hypothetical protein
MRDTKGLRFGTASAVTSSLVLLLSMRPMGQFRSALVASLLVLAFVDSLADAYAIWNTRVSFGDVVVSIVSKLVVCGSLAFAVYKGWAPIVVYGLLAAFVAAHLVLTHDHILSSVVLLCAAVAASLLIHRLLQLRKSRPQSSSSTPEDSSSEDS